MNDERLIEKLLRRYAKKRRDDAGAPVQLHPATRRMLQGEVARTLPKRPVAGDRESTTIAQILIGWRARLIWVVPALVMLGIGVWVLVGPNETSQEYSLAKNTAAPTGMVEDSFRAIETPSPAGPPAPVANVAGRADATRSQARPASTGSPKSAAGRSGEPLKGEALVRRQGDATAVAQLAAPAQSKPALKLKADRAAADEIAQAGTLDQSRSQTTGAKDEPIQAARILTDDKKQANAPAAAALTRADSVENFAYAPKAFGVTTGDGVATVPSRKPATFSAETSSRFYRQEARDTGGRDQAQAYSQAFINRAPAPAYGKIPEASPNAPVLVKFQVEQTGNQLRVVDSDGSTYLGEMHAPAEAGIVMPEVEKKGGGVLNLKSANAPTDRERTVTAMPQQQAAQNYFVCRVAGTNRTLNQPVVFTWNFVAWTNGLAAAQVKLPAGGDNLLPNNLPAQQLPLLLNSSAINGRAQLGNAKEIEVNAVPVTR